MNPNNSNPTADLLPGTDRADTGTPPPVSARADQPITRHEGIAS